MIKRFFAIVLLITLLTACQSSNSAAPERAPKVGAAISQAPGSTPAAYKPAASETIPSPVTGGSSDVTSGKSSEKENTSEERMLNDLANYILKCETMYRDLLWVLDSFDQFDGDKNWENLQFARASLAVARHYITKYSLPESEMTTEDETDLIRRGIDVSMMETFQTSFKADQTNMENTLSNLNIYIMENVFLQDHWELCMKRAAVLRKLTACDLQYLAYMADSVLADLNDDTLTEKFHNLMDEYCPMTRACQSDVPESSEEIEKKADALEDQIQDLLSEEAKITGAHKNRKLDLEDLIKNKDFTAIAENLAEISDIPFIVTSPVWYNAEEVYYYWKEHGELLPLPAPGTKLERIPDGCSITIHGVSKEEVQDYRTELETFGFAGDETTDEKGKLTLLFKHDESTLTMVWEDGNVSIVMMENPFCFVPGWYIPALNTVN